MLKTETRTKTRSSRMSQNNDLRAKTRSWCRPTWDHTRANFGMKPFRLSTVQIIRVADHRSAMAEADDEKFLTDRGFQRVSENTPKVFYITPFPRQQNLYKLTRWTGTWRSRTRQASTLM